MKQIIEYLEKIEETRGTKAKEEILYEAFLKTNIDEFFRLTYSNTNYGISSRSFEKIVNYDGKEPYFDAGELVGKWVTAGIYSIPKLLLVKDILETVEKYTGNDLLYFLKHNLESCEPLSAKWITRLILKDLKIGISLKTINKVLDKMGKSKIEKFEVQLCGKFDSIEEYNLGYPILACVKYDGLRGFLEKSGDKVTFTSRNGENIDYVPELIGYFQNNFNDDFILDGEIMAKDFATLSKRIGRKLENFVPVEDLHFRIFDIINYEGENQADLPQSTRTELLREFIKEKSTTIIRLEESFYIKTKEQLQDFYNIIVARKEEGIIVKKLNASYDFGSRKNWYKIKPSYDATLEVIGKKLGTGRKAGLISSLLVTDSSRKVTSYVGAGLTDNDILRLMMLDRENKLINSFVDISYNEITRNKIGELSLRFPRVLKLRTDKTIADDLSV